MNSSGLLAELETLAVACDELDRRARTTGELPYADDELLLSFMTSRRRLLRELDVAGVFDAAARVHLVAYPTLCSFHDASRSLRSYLESSVRAALQLPAQLVLDADVSLDYFRDVADVDEKLLSHAEYELTHKHPRFPAGRRFARIENVMHELWFRTELKPTPILYALSAER